MRVLIIEDNIIPRLALKELLKDTGHDVLDARDALQAWQLMEQAGTPQLAILDWVLPELDGLEVCRRLRARAGTERMYLILLSSRGEPEDIAAALESGADEYLVKPIDPDELRARLAAAVRVAARQHKLAERVRELEEMLAHLQTAPG